MIHDVQVKTGAFSKHKRLRHLQFDVDIMPFDNSAMVAAYALQFVRHSYVHESLAEAAERCADDLHDASAKMRFKREVRRLRKFYPEDECQ